MLNLDHRLFHLINGVWTCRAADWFFPRLTDAHRSRVFVLVVVPLIVAAWLWRGRRRAAEALLGLALVVGAADAVGARLIKPLVHRARPADAVLRLPKAGGYSFPSNHAANCFAGATFLSSVYPQAAAPLFLGAALVGYSRIYVGAHYPTDVLGGAILGILLGLLGASLFRLAREGKFKGRSCSRGSPRE